MSDSVHTQPELIPLGSSEWLDRFVESATGLAAAELAAWADRAHSETAGLLKAAEIAEKRIAAPKGKADDPARVRNAVIQIIEQIEDSAERLQKDADAVFTGWREGWTKQLATLPETVELVADWDTWLHEAGTGPQFTWWRLRQRTARLFVKPAPPSSEVDPAEIPVPEETTGGDEPDPAEPTRDTPPASSDSGQQHGRMIPLRAVVAATTEPSTGREWAATAAKRVELTASWLRDLRRLVLQLRDLSLLRPMAPHDTEDGNVDPASIPGRVRQHAEEWQRRVDELVAAETERLTAVFADQIRADLHFWPWAGTSLLPANRYTDTRLEQLRTQVQAAQDKAVLAPGNRARGRYSNLAKDLRLASLLIQHANLAAGVAERAHKRFDETLREPFAKTTESVLATWEKVKAASSESPETLHEVMRGSADKLLTEMRYRRMPAAMQAVLEVGFEKVLAKYQTNVESLLGSLPQSEMLYVENAAGGSKTHTIPFKELLHRGAYLTFRSEFKEAEEWVKERQGDLVRGVSDLDDLLEVNISAGLDMLKRTDGAPPDEQAIESAVQGFGRLHGRMKDLEATVDKLSTEGVTQFEDVAVRFEEHLIELTDNQDLVRLRLELYRAEFRTQLWHRFLRIGERSGKGVRWLVTQAPRLLLWGRSEVERLRRLAGIGSDDEDAASRLTAFLKDMDTVVEGLPFVIQQLFKIAPLEDDRFFSGRDRELGVLAGQVEAWRAGRVASCALAGEEGSGRTTLLTMTQRTLLADDDVRQLTLTYTMLDPGKFVGMLAEQLEIGDIHDFDALEQYLMESDQRRVVIVENIQQLYLRVLDGFETLERFLLLVSRTGDKVLWILSCAWHSWQYLNRVLNIEGYIQRVIKLDTLTQEEVRAIIGRRHTVSGFHRVYIPTNEDLEMRRFKKARSPEERNELAEDLFFQRLQGIAAGNIAVALQFYLRAVTKVDGDTLYLTTDVRLDEAALSGLTMDERFTLAAVVLHSGLTSEEHSQVFRQELNRSLRVLMKLKNMGVLVQVDQVFRLHQTVHRPILRALRETNVLH